MILTAPVSSPTAAGSIKSSAGPLIVLLVTLIAEPSAPVWNAVAVITPVILTSPVPVIFLELRSKSPPSCGVVSPMIWVAIPVKEVNG